MKKLNIKKLKLNKSTVNSLNQEKTRLIVGGIAGANDTVVVTKGTGFGMCICNATDRCRETLELDCTDTNDYKCW